MAESLHSHESTASGDQNRPVKVHHFTSHHRLPQPNTTIDHNMFPVDFRMVVNLRDPHASICFPPGSGVVGVVVCDSSELFYGSVDTLKMGAAFSATKAARDSLIGRRI